MDPIADMLIRIKNAQAVRHERVAVPFSKVKFNIAQLLQQEGYLAGVERTKRMARKIEVPWLDLTLKYENGLGAISGVRLMSTPSRHLYTRSKSIRPIRSGFGCAVLSTPKGIMSGKTARRENVGGEMLFEIW